MFIAVHRLDEFDKYKINKEILLYDKTIANNELKLMELLEESARLRARIKHHKSNRSVAKRILKSKS